MDVKTLPTMCSRCLKTVSPVLILDDCDLEIDAEIAVCRECLADMMDFIGPEPNSADTAQIRDQNREIARLRRLLKDEIRLTHNRLAQQRRIGAEELPMTPDPLPNPSGFYRKYTVTRTDGRDDPAAQYIVLRIDEGAKNRNAAILGARAYASAIEDACPHLAADILHHCPDPAQKEE